MEVARRILSVRKGLPAPADRVTRSTIAHPSQAEFAALLGTDRYRVIDWERNGAIPERKYRERLAELSRGVFAPEDFLPAVNRADVAAYHRQMQELREKLEEGRRERQELREELEVTRDELLAEIHRLREVS